MGFPISSSFGRPQTSPKPRISPRAVRPVGRPCPADGRLQRPGRNAGNDGKSSGDEKTPNFSVFLCFFYFYGDLMVILQCFLIGFIGIYEGNLRENHRKCMGKPWGTHRKMEIYPLGMTHSLRT